MKLKKFFPKTLEKRIISVSLTKRGIETILYENTLQRLTKAHKKQIRAFLDEVKEGLK